MSPKSILLMPPRPLASCLFLGVVRDTRGCHLSDAQRINHFPASPLVTLTRVAAGEVRLLPGSDLRGAKTARPLAPLSVLGPQDAPLSSWSPGPVAAITIGLFPDAWARLGSHQDVVCKAFAQAFDADTLYHPTTGWAQFCDRISPLWQDVRLSGGHGDWAGTARLSDWARALMARAFVHGKGQGARSIQRRIKRWSGQTQQALTFYSAAENLHRISVQQAGAPLAAIAQDAGFSDQSHMGRTVRRATGFSPAALNQMIETDEAFWWYRLMGMQY